VPETYHVTKLVNNYSKFITVFADTDSLIAVAPFTNK